MNRRDILRSGLTAFLGLRLPSTSKAGETPTNHYPELIRTVWAIAMVESGGDPQAIGDGGKALGLFQCHADYWADGCRFLGVNWPYDDARNAVKSLCVTAAYLDHYQRVGGYPATPETWARLHVSGPRGPNKAASLPYWNRVNTILSERGH